MNYKFIAVPLIFFSLISCEKLVEVGSPVTKSDAKNVYDNDANAIAVLTGIYQQMSADGEPFQGTTSISFIAGLSSDELIDYPGYNDQRTAAYQNQLSSAEYPGVPFWSRLFYYVYSTNTAIQGITRSSKLSPAVKLQLLGEAKFMRAFFYFYLVNFWGDVPLITTTDYVKNRFASRASKDQVYQQIIKDLTEAIDLLPTEYFLSDLKTITDQRIRPNKWAAKSLLARVYLYVNDYVHAEEEANAVINNSDKFELTSLNEVFLKDSKEAIWQIQSIDVAWNTFDAPGFVLIDVPGYFQPVSLSSTLVEAFERGDKRKDEWIGNLIASPDFYYYAYKYKQNMENAPKTEYLVVLRLAEQYLIRAEARAQLNDINGAVADVNVIRSRARAIATDEIPDPLPNLQTTISKVDLVTAILKERQVELFTEWGHRWLDLKRTNTVDDVMKIITPLKGGTWNSTKSLFPIPQYDIAVNNNILQNQGY